MSTTQIVVWNCHDYPSLEAAESMGAVTIHEINPDIVPAQAIPAFVDAFVHGLVRAEQRLVNTSSQLMYETREVNTYVVSAEVLEWNKYTVAVQAASPEAAKELIKEQGIVTFSPLDVESGVSGCRGSTQRNETLGGE